MLDFALCSPSEQKDDAEWLLSAIGVTADLVREFITFMQKPLYQSNPLALQREGTKRDVLSILVD